MVWFVYIFDRAEQMKKKVRKEYLKRTRKLLKTKLCRKNLIKGKNTWAVLLVRYFEPFLKCIQTNGTKDKEIDDTAPGLTLDR